MQMRPASRNACRRRAGIAFFAVVTGLVVASCGSWSPRWDAGSPPRDDTAVEQGSKTADATSSADPSTSLARQPSSANPALDLDFPDPYVLATAGGYRAFGTNSRGLNVPTASSDDLATWAQVGDALPDLPWWVGADSVWAPSVRQVGSSFVMYVTAGDLRRDRQCVFVATSDAVAGPYTLSDQPIVCDSGGSIDASPSTDADGVLRLVWKDERADGTPSRIRSARLTDDGVQLAEQPVTLLSSAEVAAHDTVEAPSLVRTDHGAVLFFSVGDWKTDAYRTGYAVCASLSGPCQVRSSDWLTTAASGSGPGGLEAFTGIDGHAYAAYHTWSRARRVLNIDGLELAADESPVLVPRPSSQAQ
jgi:arabinan endo-1,5-alpha-L-arabinosidase